MFGCRSFVAWQQNIFPARHVIDSQHPKSESDASNAADKMEDTTL